MPKIKTNRSAAKRFRVKAGGKIKRAQAYKNHILTKKSAKRKLHLRGGVYVDDSNIENVRRLLGM